MTDSILNAIGNTPLIEIKKLNPNPKVKIFAKIEYFNPGGSVKDRPALFMIEKGEKQGLLTKDKTVIEATSGNTGIGLALVCSVKGYKLLLTMSESVSLERQKILKARGADILLTPGHLGTDGAIEEAYRLARENPEKYFITDQFNNDANWKAHYYGTGNEILKQTKNQITTFVASMGTTGTLMGVSKRLKEYNKNIQIIGVEPYLGHKIQGLKNLKEAYVPEIFDKTCLDQKINIDDDKAYEMARQLAKKEGIFVGMSSGAAMAIAAKQATSMTSGIIVVLFADCGERYLSTPLFTIKDKIKLNIFNSLTKKIEPFTPNSVDKVSIYSCGPTAHAKIHINECRRFVFSDLLTRYLEYKGFFVDHITNITDLDDKTIKGADKAGIDLKEFTEKYIKEFKKDLKKLNIKPASKYPKASCHINEMVNLSQKLVDKGYAYEKLHSLYFNIAKFNEYGKLSGMDLEQIKSGITVDLDEYEKDNPRDFTLFKRSKLSELKKGIYTKTPWGTTRPSWHIQCAAISTKHLGDNFDIHTGSRNLIFPHHENELAIAKAATKKDLANYWLHCEQVNTDAKGNKDDIMLDDLINSGFSPREIRFWLISVHYRKPIWYSIDKITNAKKSLNRIDNCIYLLQQIKDNNAGCDIDQTIYDLKNGFLSAMDNDLNISCAMTEIFKFVKKINVLITKNEISIKNAKKALNAFKKIDSVLKVFNFDIVSEDKEIKALIDKRCKARKDKNWKLADSLRDQLVEKGYLVRDVGK